MDWLWLTTYLLVIGSYHVILRARERNFWRLWDEYNKLMEEHRRLASQSVWLARQAPPVDLLPRERED